MKACSNLANRIVWFVSVIIDSTCPPEKNTKGWSSEGTLSYRKNHTWLFIWISTEAILKYSWFWCSFLFLPKHNILESGTRGFVVEFLRASHYSQQSWCEVSALYLGPKCWKCRPKTHAKLLTFEKKKLIFYCFAPSIFGYRSGNFTIKGYLIMITSLLLQPPSTLASFHCFIFYYLVSAFIL